MDRSKTLHQVSPPFESLSTVNTALHSCLIIALLFIIFCSPDLLLFGCCYLSFSTMRLRCGVQHVGVCHIYQTTVLSPNICPPPALHLPFLFLCAQVQPPPVAAWFGKRCVARFETLFPRAVFKHWNVFQHTHTERTASSSVCVRRYSLNLTKKVYWIRTHL